MSPEQAAGEPVDARSDLYSLGVVGYYGLTGRLPFDGATSAEVVAQHLTIVPESITSVAGSVPPRLAAAVERCLHKDPARRYASAESFAEAIDLAFEHAKEIPAPLRSWINQGDREVPARVAMLGIGAITGIGMALGFENPAIFLIPFVMMGGLSLIPPLTRLRLVLANGYHIDDLHAALREHQLVRSEEIEYERRQTSPRTRGVLRVILGLSIGGATFSLFTIARATGWAHSALGTELANAAFDHAMNVAGAVMVGSLTGLTIAGVPLGGEFVRHRLASRMTSASISFWKGKWGARVARLAGIGLKPVERPTLGMPVLTEVALGRATDHLFQALPKTTRRELAALPETVRRLEADASAMRVHINALDDQLAAFERGGDALRDGPRSALAADLVAVRERGAERLAATVAALERIRLDLLRLQMGTAEVHSVTATLDAAREIGDRIAESLAAQAEVDRLLRDDDTPVPGVPALS